MPEKQKPDVLVVGHFPPPVHGHAIATVDMVSRLRASELIVVTCNVGGMGGLAGYFKRLRRHATAAWRIVASRAPVVYLTVNDRNGMLLTALLVAVARAMRRQIVLHHHSNRYITHDRRLFAVLTRLAGPRTLHITQSAGLAERLQDRYPAVRRIQGFSNVGGISPSGEPQLRPSRPITVGHLSNLTEEKGVGRVLSSLNHLSDDIHVVIAGPCHDAAASAAIAAAARDHADRFTYLGALGPRDKEAFFAGIDIFAFPSLYPAETQGIVNLEALAHGVPVVSYDRGCIADDIGKTGGTIVDETQDFAPQLAAFIDRFAAAPEVMRQDAFKRFKTLRADHAAEVRQLIAQIHAMADKPEP